MIPVVRDPRDEQDRAEDGRRNICMNGQVLSIEAGLQQEITLRSLDSSDGMYVE